MPRIRYRHALLALGLQTLAAAANAEVLLEKQTYPGFVLPAYAISTHCTLADDGKLFIEYQLGSLKSSRSQQLKLSTSSIKRSILEAAQGNITTNPYPVDVPITIYRAYQYPPNSDPKTVTLLERNGGSGTETVNDSQAALALRNFIDLNCGDPLQY
jgi:hypothetical protein